jgi:hypothetical protein
MPVYKQSRVAVAKRQAVLGKVTKQFQAMRYEAELAMFEKPVLEVEDVRSYDIVRSAIQAAFASPTTDKFLKRIAAERLRVRDFELVLSKGLLGQEALTAYGHLGNLDRGQIRELYLASVEHVAPELRAKHLKIYAYY